MDIMNLKANEEVYFRISKPFKTFIEGNLDTYYLCKGLIVDPGISYGDEKKGIEVLVIKIYNSSPDIEETLGQSIEINSYQFIDNPKQGAIFLMDKLADVWNEYHKVYPVKSKQGLDMINLVDFQFHINILHRIIVTNEAMKEMPELFAPKFKTNKNV